MRIRDLILFLLVVPSTAVLADPRRFPPLSPDSSAEEWAQYERLTKQLRKNPPHLTPERLPNGFRMGRCLLEVEGKTYVAGDCAYTISRGGEFEFYGPRQVYTGIDYPDPGGQPFVISTDYFVFVSHELRDDGTEGPGWTARWNEDKRNNHAQSYLGSVKRKGACYSNAKTKICLWKS